MDKYPAFPPLSAIILGHVSHILSRVPSTLSPNCPQQQLAHEHSLCLLFACLHLTSSLPHSASWNHFPNKMLNTKPLGSRKSNAPTQSLHPNLQNLWIHLVTRQRRMKFADGIEVANQLTSILGDYSGLSLITRVFKSGRRNRKRQPERCTVRRTWPDQCRLWRWRKGAMSQGIQAASRSWKRPGNEFSLKLP